MWAINHPDHPVPPEPLINRVMFALLVLFLLGSVMLVVLLQRGHL